MSSSVRCTWNLARKSLPSPARLLSADRCEPRETRLTAAFLRRGSRFARRPSYGYRGSVRSAYRYMASVFLTEYERLALERYLRAVEQAYGLPPGVSDALKAVQRECPVRRGLTVANTDLVHVTRAER